MPKTLFIVALILILAWAVGFIGFHVTGIIHILPAIAIFALLVRLVYNKLSMK